jgi:hypothetical protein
MTPSAALKRITAANEQLDHTIESLVAFAPAPDYVRSLRATASLLQDLSFSQLTPSEKALIAEQTRILQHRTAQAEALFHAAGTLHFGSLLNNNTVQSSYAPDGTADTYSGSGFQIDG